MSSNSSSSSPLIRSQNPKIFRLGTDGNVYCNHELLAIRRVAGNRSSRQGEEFYGCPLWPRSDCKFFVWKQEVDVVLATECNCGVSEMKNARVAIEKRVLEEENRRLRKPSKKAYFLAVVWIALLMYWLF
ncbi:putative transcription factor GRF family [Helianthus annuus]|nr:putative transcription factor GRF family [Helianthus annuus]